MLPPLLLRPLAGLLSPSGPRARLNILIYHRVLPHQDEVFPLDATVDSFDRQMAQVKSCFNVLPLAEAVARLRAGSLPPRAACITFDDGYADNLTLATPILRKHGLTATFFVATAYLDGGRMFNDTVIEAVRKASTDLADLSDLGLGRHDLSTPEAKAAALGAILPRIKPLPPGRREETAEAVATIISNHPLPTNLMMTSAQVRELHQLGMSIGGHTHLHPILAGMDEQEVRLEIMAGKERLESLLGEKVRLFAYPNGRPGDDYLPDQARIVAKLGFDAAVSTRTGCATSASDPYQLPRFTPWSPRRFVPQLLGNLRNPA